MYLSSLVADHSDRIWHSEANSVSNTNAMASVVYIDFDNMVFSPLAGDTFIRRLSTDAYRNTEIAVASRFKWYPVKHRRPKYDERLFDPARLQVLLCQLKSSATMSNVDSQLRTSCITGRAFLALRLLNHNHAYVNSCDAGSQWTPLILAARYGNLHNVKVLLDHSCDVNMITNNGWNALQYAVFFGYTNIVSLLLNVTDLQNGTNTNNGWTALMYASCWGNEEIVDMLLNADPPARVAHCTPTHQTALTVCGLKKQCISIRNKLTLVRAKQERVGIIAAIIFHTWEVFGLVVPENVARLMSLFWFMFDE